MPQTKEYRLGGTVLEVINVWLSSYRNGCFQATPRESGLPASWRLERRGPVFVKIGQLVRYRPEDLESWLKALPTGGLTPDRRQPAVESQSAVSPRRVSA